MAAPSVLHGGEDPTPLPVDVDLPETAGYKLKRWLLGKPLTTDQLRTERLSGPVAMGVLTPDCISSSAYGTQEMLTMLVPYVGIAAFALVIPVTIAILVILFFVTMSYLEVLQVYTKAGGSYVVARENFGFGVAQIAAVALIIDYTVTVAVQVAAGSDALASAFPTLTPYVLPISLGVVLVLTYGNLRGIREAGRAFAFPTYFFIVSLGFVIIVGMIKAGLGELRVHSIHHPGVVPIGHPGSGLLMGATLFVLLRAFANGGSSLTGLEAISNGVSSFKTPEAPRARKTLVVMSATLGFLVLGVSMLAHFTHAVPYVSGAPTVPAQEIRYVFGYGAFASVVFYVVQAATMLILFTGGNTSFNGFPYLVSFVAEDSFLPRWFSHRGQRLAFSNGILVLAAVALALLAATGASVDALVGLYAIGVFTGFTMAGVGMVAYHRRERERGWRYKQVINGSAAALSGIVVVIFVVTKFTQGAWLVVVVGPILVYTFIRFNRRYREEAAALRLASPRLARHQDLPRHSVLILVDDLDLATMRALGYARRLKPTSVRAVHFVLDSARAADLQHRWQQLPSSEVPLELVECPDRRLARAALELVAGAAADGGTAVTVLLPRRVYRPVAGRLLHDRTADRIAAQTGRIPHAAATIVPFDAAYPLRTVRERAGAAEVSTGAVSGSPGGDLRPLSEHPEHLEHLEPPVAPGQPEGPGTGDRADSPAPGEGGRPRPAAGVQPAAGVEAPESATRPRGYLATPIAAVHYRQRARVQARVRSVQVRPLADSPVLECTVSDATGGLTVLFYGRREISGIVPGARVQLTGMVSEFDGHLAMANPSYELLEEPEPPRSR